MSGSIKETVKNIQAYGYTWTVAMIPNLHIAVVIEEIAVRRKWLICSVFHYILQSRLINMQQSQISGSMAVIIISQS